MLFEGMPVDARADPVVKDGTSRKPPVVDALAPAELEAIWRTIGKPKILKFGGDGAVARTATIVRTEAQPV